MMKQDVHMGAFNCSALAIRTSAIDGGVDRKEQGALLVSCAYSTRVVSVVTKVVGTSPWSYSTISAKFSLSICNSTLVLSMVQPHLPHS